MVCLALLARHGKANPRGHPALEDRADGGERRFADQGQLLAIQEINNSGGLLGRKVKAVEVDGRSDPEVYAREADRLIGDEKVAVIFGCYNSATRKAVKPVVERHDHLLVFPVAYEGSSSLRTSSTPVPCRTSRSSPLCPWCSQVLKAKSST